MIVLEVDTRPASILQALGRVQEIWPDERILVTNLSRCEPDCVRRGPDQYFALNRLAGPNGVRGFPRTLAFQSVVEATIPPATVIDKLFTNLATGGTSIGSV